MQPMAQPAWLEMHSVVRRGYPISTASIEAPSGARKSHLRVVPASADCATSTVNGQSLSPISARIAPGRVTLTPAVVSVRP